jgi:pimeloyl-ACP methyl ester carboxylesterase
VLALDLRGHGGSERQPEVVGLEAMVKDAVAAAATFERPPVVVGQSLGGSVAIALAGRNRDVVRALGVVEASPSADQSAAEVVRRWVDSWPAPFSSRLEAEAFFGGGRAGAAWAEGLVAEPEGLVPAFDPDVVEQAVRSVGVDLWPEWRAVACPALVVRAARGDLSLEEARRMAEANRRARLVLVADAGHDAHLEDPIGLRAALEPFVRETVPPPGHTT